LKNNTVNILTRKRVLSIAIISYEELFLVAPSIKETSVPGLAVYETLVPHENMKTSATPITSELAKRMKGHCRQLQNVGIISY
jgi:hypothetical protein